MTLLEDIQTAAVDASNDVGTLLRKCKLLAARLQSQPLEDWVIWESNGYPENIEVPDYRIWPLEVKGHFSGAFGSGISECIHQALGQVGALLDLGLDPVSWTHSERRLRCPRWRRHDEWPAATPAVLTVQSL